jgi:hypothetical protein
VPRPLRRPRPPWRHCGQWDPMPPAPTSCQRPYHALAGNWSSTTQRHFASACRAPSIQACICAGMLGGRLRVQTLRPRPPFRWTRGRLRDRALPLGGFRRPRGSCRLPQALEGGAAGAVPRPLRRPRPPWRHCGQWDPMPPAPTSCQRPYHALAGNWSSTTQRHFASACRAPSIQACICAGMLGGRLRVQTLRPRPPFRWTRGRLRDRALPLGGPQ